LARRLPIKPLQRARRFRGDAAVATMASMNEASPSPGRRPVSLNLLLAATAFLSAWLLFQVQPMVARRILPWFGGGTAVWTTVMLFFQAALFAGYLYAHLLAQRAPRLQAGLHVALLAAAAAMALLIGVLPADWWKPAVGDLPALRILAMLAACIGLPFVMLAATAPLVQAWYARVNGGASPYRLYALSNVGSLAALLSYPLVVEPTIALSRQGELWALLFAAFATACGASALLALRAAGPLAIESAAGAAAPPIEARPRRLERFFWIALPACASVALLAITAHLCTDVAPIPLLWVAPMAVYLLSFIATFDSDRWYDRRIWLPAAAVASFAAVWVWQADTGQTFASLRSQIIVHLVLLLAFCMVCHGELARMRPPAARLTNFYLSIAAGGVLGGLLVGVVAPLVLSNNYELQLGMLAAWLLAMAVLATDRQSPLYDGGYFRGWLGMAVLLIALGAAMSVYVAEKATRAVARARNFYGVLTLRELNRETPIAFYELTNGQVSHGSQFRDETNRRIPTLYYHADSGVAPAVMTADPHQARRVGVVGLGAGTLAAYAEKGDEFRFYDVNPQVLDFAEKYFTYLADARARGAKTTLVEGDARLALEREPPQQFDVLVLDAFNSDAIPVHLLTLEAFEVYLKHLKEPDGILAVHVTNEHLDLEPVVVSAAERFGLDGVYIHAEPDESPSSAQSMWVLLSRQPGRFGDLNVGRPLETSPGRDPVVWTDDFSSVLSVLEE
jgi:hypothetical protein